jgi:adenylosuccinate lyase
MLQTMTEVIRELVVHPDRMRANVESTHGVIFSGQVLLALMRRGLSRSQAYRLVQRCALAAWRNGGDFSEALLRDQAVRRHLSPQALRRCVDPRVHLRHVQRVFRRVGL